MSFFGKIDTDRMVENIRILANRSIHTVAEQFGDGAKGGALTIVGYEEGPLLYEAINEENKEKARLLVYQSMMQASLIQISVLAYTSWQCIDTQGNRAGGAIPFCRRYILSFAGFPERTNEAFCIALAYTCGYLNEIDVNNITEISGNREHASEVLNVVTDFL